MTVSILVAGRWHWRLRSSAARLPLASKDCQTVVSSVGLLVAIGSSSNPVTLRLRGMGMPCFQAKA